MLDLWSNASGDSKGLAMRSSLAAVAAVIGLTTTVASAAPASPEPSAALASGDWLRAAQLGASAADVVRGLQAKGRFAEAVPEKSVVTIGPDNAVAVVVLEPLPPLEGAEATGPNARTVNLFGSGFAFSAKPGSIILYPAHAATFAPQSDQRGEFELHRRQRIG